MIIHEVVQNKQQYMPLLLLADEQESMIEKYLFKGRLFVLEDNGLCSECIVTDEGEGILEIKSLATVPARQRKGYGKTMIRFLLHHFQREYQVLQVGTGNSPATVPFYEKCGFRYHHCIPNFFIDHYDHPIIEEGILLTDMVVYRMPFRLHKHDSE